MATRDLPDMYALGLRAEGMHIRQIMNGRVTSIMYHFVPIGNNTSSLNPTSNCHTCS